ncbi:hypothetical protein HQ520_09405 [bacterium]|nr:hypothetical protein [bacterium]
MTRKIIEEHGGKMKVESVVGRGSSFQMIIPEKTPVSSHRKPAEEPAEVQAGQPA